MSKVKSLILGTAVVIGTLAPAAIANAGVSLTNHSETVLADRW